MGARTPIRLCRLGLVAIPLALALGFGTAQAETRLYRWVDENGIVHYTDQIPPGQVGRGHTELNRQGIPVETVPPAKTPEEVQWEQELERLRTQRERLIEEQKAADRLLLRTFPSIDDLTMARNGKLASIDLAIQVARGNAYRQKEWLESLRSEAANFERTGKPVPSHILEGIAKAESNIRDAYTAILAREQEKDETRMEFDRDLKRFRQLKRIPDDAAAAPKEIVRPVLRNLAVCSGKAQCDLYWERAMAYVKSKSVDPVQAVGEYVLTTAPAQTPDDVNMTCLLYTSPSPRDATLSRMPSSA